jgi:hypothetical protein
MSSDRSTRETESRPTASRKPLFNGWRGLVLLIVLGIAPLWHLHIINRMMPPQKADMVAVWKGAQATFSGRDPYSDATMGDIQLFYYGREVTPADRVNPMGYAYPMHTIILFAPIALLPWSAVRVVFFILLPLLTVASALIWLDVTGMQLSRLKTAFLCLCCWPSMWAIHQIQPTIVVAALLAAACLLVRRGNMVPAGIFLAMATIKPQLAAILIAWLLLWTILRGIWTLLLSFSVSLAALLGCATWLLPGWVHGWRAAAAEYAVYRHLRLDLQGVFGHIPGLILSAALVFCATSLLWRCRRCAAWSSDFGAMCALSLAITVCILPTELAMTYNYVLLFPACFILIQYELPENSAGGLARSIAVGMISWSFLSVIIAVLVESLIRPTDFLDALPFQTAVLPASVLVALIYPLLAEKFRSAPVQIAQVQSV